MTELTEPRECARTLIREACELLVSVRAGKWPWALDWEAFQPDLIVLLEDAVHLYCRAVGSDFNPGDHRAGLAHWAQWLAACPEQCDHILERLAGVAPPKSQPVGQPA